ncbi:MAG: hypothetical protein KatS3mg053_0786 [Candidatus Roseilinea sp.]|nr:MAG: hypothetical protein KatS3mg053_0786 [Candidatus Roseilinea sp.]
MNAATDLFQGKWPHLRLEAMQFFSELTDDDLIEIDRDTENIIPILQRRYRISEDMAHAELDRFVGAFSYVMDGAEEKSAT